MSDCFKSHHRLRDQTNVSFWVKDSGPRLPHWRNRTDCNHYRKQVGKVAFLDHLAVRELVRRDIGNVYGRTCLKNAEEGALVTSSETALHDDVVTLDDDILDVHLEVGKADEKLTVKVDGLVQPICGSKGVEK